MIEWMINSESVFAYIVWLLIMLPIGTVVGSIIFYPLWELVKRKDTKGERRRN